jgi:endonuclease-3
MTIFLTMEDHLGNLGRPSPMIRGSDPFAVLVSTLISLRTRDTVTEKVAARVLSFAPDPDSILDLQPGELENLLKPAGFYRKKAVQLRGICNAIRDRFAGSVPDRMEDLLSLPGVGRKTACYVVGMVFSQPAVCVDVHVHRISNRIGLADTSSPSGTEEALMKIYPESIWNRINHLFVRFGQRVCRPRNPLCGHCPFGIWCPSSGSRAISRRAEEK